MSRVWEALQKVESEGLIGSGDAHRHLPSAEAIDGLAEVPESVRVSVPSAVDEANVDYEVEDVRAERIARLVCHTDPSGPAADKFRLLRMRLRGLWMAGKLKTLLVTSPLPADGKTTISLNLASVLAEQRKQRVLLIDADLRRASVSEQLGLMPGAGLAECLQDGLDPFSAIRRIEPLGWHVLSAGVTRVDNPAELLRLQEISRLIQMLSPHFDWILIDSPPVLVFTDAISLAQACDGTLFVARAGRTSSKAIEDALALLGRKHVTAFVLNGIATAEQPYSKHYGYYRGRGGSASNEKSATAEP